MWWIVVVGFAGEVDRYTPVVRAVERATPSVVALEVEVEKTSPFGFYGKQTTASEGSGVVIDASGAVLTNAHVVQGATRILAHTHDGSVFEARPVAVDADLDLAVLKLEDAKAVIPIDMADSDDLLLGETVIAIGNPYGLGLTVSSGIVASKSRAVEIQPGVSQRYIQTDAAINPGNSGGALIDIEGRLIGINTAIRAEAEGIGFAIPANRARKVAADLLAFGSVRAPWLGCAFRDVQLGRAAKRALQVTAVVRNGPCDRAGVEAGDLVGRIGNHDVSSRADLNTWLADHEPGETFPLELWRASKKSSVQVKTADLPQNAGLSSLRRLGIDVQPLEQQALTVTAAAPRGTWTAAGLRAGDVILAVDGARLKDKDALTTRLEYALARHRGTVLFTVQRGRSRAHVEVNL